MLLLYNSMPFNHNSNLLYAIICFPFFLSASLKNEKLPWCNFWSVHIFTSWRNQDKITLVCKQNVMFFLFLFNIYFFIRCVNYQCIIICVTILMNTPQWSVMKLHWSEPPHHLWGAEHNFPIHNDHSSSNSSSSSSRIAIE